MGVVIPERPRGGIDGHSGAGVGGSAGAFAGAKVTNLVRAMEELKEMGYWLGDLMREGIRVTRS